MADEMGMKDVGETDRRSHTRRKGASGMEYGVMIGLVAVVAVAATATVGGKVREIFGGTTNAVGYSMAAGSSGISQPAQMSLMGGVAGAPPPSFSQPSGTIVASVRPLQANGPAGQLQASDPGGQPMTFSATGLPAWLSLNASSGALSILSAPPTTASNLSFPFTATVSDPLNGSSSSTFSVKVTNTPPSIASGSIASVQPGQGPGTVTTIVAPDPDGDAAAFSATGLPAWLSLAANGTLSIPSGQAAPTAAAGTSWSFSITAQDGKGGSTTQSQSISMANAAPIVATTTLSAAYLGAAYSQTLAASDANGDAISWSLASGTLPTGLSLASSGAITGTPTATGTSSFVVQASDEYGGTSTQAFTISAQNAISVVISSNAQNANVKSLAMAASGGWNGTTPTAIIVTVSSGVVLGSSSTASPALDGSALPSGSTLILNNFGTIEGAGGSGGTGGPQGLSASYANVGQPGQPGGPAISLSSPIIISNSGNIWGGGGGGAGGHGTNTPRGIAMGLVVAVAAVVAGSRQDQEGLEPMVRPAAREGPPPPAGQVAPDVAAPGKEALLPAATAAPQAPPDPLLG